MNKKNLRMAGLIVGGVLIWMLLGLFAPAESEFEEDKLLKITVLTKNSSATDYRLPIYTKSESEAFQKLRSNPRHQKKLSICISAMEILQKKVKLFVNLILTKTG